MIKMTKLKHVRPHRLFKLAHTSLKVFSRLYPFVVQRLNVSPAFFFLCSISKNSCPYLQHCLHNEFIPPILALYEPCVSFYSPSLTFPYANSSITVEFQFTAKLEARRIWSVGEISLRLFGLLRGSTAPGTSIF